MKPLSPALTMLQSVPVNSNPGPVHPDMSPLEELLSNCHQIKLAFPQGREVVGNGGKWGELATGGGGLHCFFSEGLDALASLGTIALSLVYAYPGALMSELYEQVADSTVPAGGY